MGAKIILRKRENPFKKGKSYWVAYFRYEDTNEDLAVGRSSENADALKAELEKIYNLQVEIERGR